MKNIVSVLMFILVSALAFAGTKTTNSVKQNIDSQDSSLTTTNIALKGVLLESINLVINYKEHPEKINLTNYVELLIVENKDFENCIISGVSYYDKIHKTYNILFDKLIRVKNDYKYSIVYLEGKAISISKNSTNDGIIPRKEYSKENKDVIQLGALVYSFIDIKISKYSKFEHSMDRKQGYSIYLY